MLQTLVLVQQQLLQLLLLRQLILWTASRRPVWTWQACRHWRRVVLLCALTSHLLQLQRRPHVLLGSPYLSRLHCVTLRACTAQLSHSGHALLMHGKCVLRAVSVSRVYASSPIAPHSPIVFNNKPPRMITHTCCPPDPPPHHTPHVLPHVLLHVLLHVLHPPSLSAESAA